MRGARGRVCRDDGVGGVKGRGGFKLSAGALYPKDDYDWIVKGGTYQVLTAQVTGPRTPRIALAAPEKSLLLLKPTGSVAHGGGKRFAVDRSADLNSWSNAASDITGQDALQEIAEPLSGANNQFYRIRSAP